MAAHPVYLGTAPLQPGVATNPTVGGLGGHSHNAPHYYYDVHQHYQHHAMFVPPPAPGMLPFPGGTGTQPFPLHNYQHLYQQQHHHQHGQLQAHSAAALMAAPGIGGLPYASPGPLPPPPPRQFPPHAAPHPPPPPPPPPPAQAPAVHPHSPLQQPTAIPRPSQYAWGAMAQQQQHQQQQPREASAPPTASAANREKDAPPTAVVGPLPTAAAPSSAESHHSRMNDQAPPPTQRGPPLHATASGGSNNNKGRGTSRRGVPADGRPERYKTAMCKHAVNGLCLRGSACRFAHDETELRAPAAAAAPTPAGHG
jgi:hypothetical protein